MVLPRSKNSRFKGFVIVVSLAVSWPSVLAGVPELRGIAPDEQAKYAAASPDGAFQCADGSGAGLKITALNDEFCDCRDGSDEPGTGACAGSHNTLFHCSNEGSTPQLIYVSRVDDGICDCCDGSDEEGLAKRGKRKSCPNNCAEQGERERAERAKRLEILKDGLSKQGNIVQTAKKEREQMRGELAGLKAALPALEAKLAEESEIKRLAEVGSGCNCSEEVASKQKEIDSLKAEIARLKGEGGADVPDPVDFDLQASKPVVKKKVVSEYAKWMDGAESTPGALEDEKVHVTEEEEDSDKDDPDDSSEDEDGDGDDDGDETLVEEDEVDLPGGFRKGQRIRAASDLKIGEAGQETIVVLKGSPGSILGPGQTDESVDSGQLLVRFDTVTQDAATDYNVQPSEIEALDTLSRHAAAEKQVKANKDRSASIDKKLRQLDEDRLRYATLASKCLKKKFTEYEYKICFFERANQGDHVSLGRWGKWTGPKSAQFNNGDHCPGALPRELNVNFVCGSEEELLDISEPTRCSYLAYVAHPGACDEADLVEQKRVLGPRDEL